MDLGHNTYRIRKIVQTSLLIALAIVIRNLSYMVYFGGAPGMRIGFSGIFTKLSAVLFGPVYGGAASGLLDIIGYIMRPEGAYIPLLTATAVLGGLITGVLWKVLKSSGEKRVQRVFFVFFIIVGLVGVVNHLAVTVAPESLWAQIISKIGKRMDFTTIGLEVASLLGLILLAADILIKKTHRNFKVHNSFLKILMATGISGIITTTLNTYILLIFVPELGQTGFLIFWIPRLIQEVFMTIIQAYIISLLLSIYRKYIA